MALLTVAGRQARFKYLGLGKYNKKSLLKFQKKAFPTRKDLQDSKYGPITDSALRTFYNVKKCTKDFKPEEFRCTCGRCSGYPTHMKQVELRHIQKIRDHFKQPMIITSALRCDYENRRVGGIQNSGHTRGYAVDFYMKGVTQTSDQRAAAMAWIVKQPNHEFTYGAYMRDSNGLYRTAANMGNAMHTETHKPAKKVSPFYASKTILGQASSNEKGGLTGGKAGDQKKEVAMTSWYDGGWLYVFIPRDESKRLKIAQAMIDTCQNDNIGYDTQKPDRYSAYDLAEKNGHNIKKINKKCETTCSQAVSMCLRAAGYPRSAAPRHADVVSLTSALKASKKDFKRVSLASFLRSPKKLRAGYILASSHHYVVIVKTPREK